MSINENCNVNGCGGSNEAWLKRRLSKISGENVEEISKAGSEKKCRKRKREESVSVAKAGQHVGGWRHQLAASISSETMA